MSNGSTHRGHVVARVLEWLRAAYPAVVPEEDHVVLLGLLHRRLTQGEIDLVATTLVAEGRVDASAEQIREVVRRAAHEEVGEDDLRRVRALLAGGGWPLADPAQHPGDDDLDPVPHA